MLKVLIAVDGSEHARRAIEAVARLAQQSPGLEAVLLNVRDGLEYYGELQPFDHEAIEKAQRQRQSDLLEAALVHARHSGLAQVSTQAAMGVAAIEIVRAAQEQAVDQIVMGTRGRSALSNLFLGSVAQQVVHLAKVPVLLVK